ncbi:MAG TPA: serine O-acetyltransferase [Chloroflexia bacterium]|nr:serine O-acetyltransferase [Chloroflexia bacterium]
MSPIGMYRAYHRFYQRGWMKLAFWMYRLHRLIYACEIHPAAELGPGCQIPHSVGIVIGPEVRIGRLCFIGQGVTLGYRYPGPREPVRGDGNPVVGDRVVIGAGAKVFGAITIGDHVLIGANSVVTRSVPADHIAVGVPAVIRPRRRPSPAWETADDSSLMV